MLRRGASWLLLALVVSAGPAVGAGERFPRFTAPVVDAADVVPDDAEDQINSQLLDYQRRSGNQIAVAVVRTLGRASLEDYSEDLFDAWGVGEKGKDNGALLVIAMRERDIRIEVGYGLEGDLTDLESGDIVDSMRDLMRAGDVGGAIELATDGIRRALGDTEVGAPPQAEPTEEPQGSWFPLVFALIPLFFLLGGLGRRGRRRRRWDLGPIFWGGGLGGSGGSSGGFGGGFGGGGFGGGGGGGSGGGGASGGW
ncbi:MAG TPA: TPM domain-containing protein [Actinomycetota bacterium]|jgi:uncharacterized protein|nr:TPM domain-containing protein [Actinomycetota bacterium]